MNLKEQTNQLLKKHGLWLQKALGQNFLIDEGSLQAIVNAANLQPSDTVLEIGPGSGVLTRELLKQTPNVVAVEKDTRLKAVLKDLPVTYGDGLKFNPDELPGPYKLIANIPYYITSPLINHYLKDQFLRKDGKPNPPTLIVLLIQKEVAEKITDPNKNSYLSLNIRSFGEPSIVAEVPRKHFLPAPKVDSAIIKIEVKPNPLLQDIDLKKYFSIIGQGFGSPRKKVGNNLKGAMKLAGLSKDDLAQKTGIDLSQRPEDLQIEDWVKLVNVF